MYKLLHFVFNMSSTAYKKVEELNKLAKIAAMKYIKLALVITKNSLSSSFTA